MSKLLAGVACLLVCACGSEAVQTEKISTSGKSDVPLAQVPAEVLATATAARAGFTAQEAEREIREDREYYDIEGKLADGTEVEFDIMRDGAGWKVVEVQRDIAFEAAPKQVRESAAATAPGFVPTRVIESSQSDGVVIYELFGPEASDPQGKKIEVKWDGRSAEVLTREWAH